MNEIEQKVNAVAQEAIRQKSQNIDDMAESVKRNQGSERAEEMASHLQQLRQRITQDIETLASQRTAMLQEHYQASKDESVLTQADAKFDSEVRILMDSRVSQMMDDMNGGLLTYEQSTQLVQGGFLLAVTLLVLYVLYKIFY